MKKIIFLTVVSTILFVLHGGCTGYKPIYATSNFNFKIEQHSITGDVKLGNLIYRKLNNISLSNKNNPKARRIILSIETSKEKKPKVKNNAGKVLEYQIYLNTNINMTNYLTYKTIIKQNFNYSISYKVQDEHSDTIKMENQNIENLVNKAYQDILLKISQSVVSK